MDSAVGADASVDADVPVDSGVDAAPGEQCDLPADCVATFDSDAHKFALHQLKTVLGAEVTGTPTG